MHLLLGLHQQSHSPTALDTLFSGCACYQWPPHISEVASLLPMVVGLPHPHKPGSQHTVQRPWQVGLGWTLFGTGVTNYFELALLTWVDLVPTQSLRMIEATWLADSLPASLVIPRMRVSISKPHEYQHPVKCIGKHILGKSCEWLRVSFCHHLKSVQLRPVCQGLWTMCWDPGLWGWEYQ